MEHQATSSNDEDNASDDDKDEKDEKENVNHECPKKECRHILRLW